MDACDLPATFYVVAPGIQVVEEIGAHLGGMFMEQWFRKQVVRFKITPAVSACIGENKNIQLARAEATVVGEEPTAQPSRKSKRGPHRASIWTYTDYMNMRKQAEELAQQFDFHCAAARHTVKGDGWCWLYALSFAFGAELDHPLKARRDELQHQLQPTAHDRALVKDVLAHVQE